MKKHRGKFNFDVLKVAFACSLPFFLIFIYLKFNFNAKKLYKKFNFF